jgi:hypothetical protein
VNYTNGAVGTLAYSWELPAPFGGLRLSKIQGTAGAITFESNGFLAVQSGKRRRISMAGLLDPTGTRGMWNDFLRGLETGADTLYTLDMAQRDLRFVEDASATHGARCREELLQSCGATWPSRRSTEESTFPLQPLGDHAP